MTRSRRSGAKHTTRRGTKRLKRSGTKRSKRSRGGAQGAPLDQAFSGVVLPSDVYRPILKPMHGGDGFAYQGANLAPVYAPTKVRRGRRRSVKRSVKRKGKARGPGLPPGHALPVGHALPQGFGQMVQSFRPL